MKVLFVLRHMIYFRLFDGAIRELAKQGYDVHISFSDVKKHNEFLKTDRAVHQCVLDYPNVTYGYTEEVKDKNPLLRDLKFILRHMAGYTIYLSPEYHPPAPVLMKRWQRYFPRRARKFSRSRVGKWLLAQPWTPTWLQRIERRLPINPSVKNWLANNRPDLVVASPYVQVDPEEVEYIKAAKKLKIPTVVAVASWDNLTNKGTFADVPDRVLLWNKGLADEAMRIHRIPAKRIAITGAPVFDPWFEMQPSVDRDAFCKGIGIDSSNPYFVYLGSSKFISKDETIFMDKLAKALTNDAHTQHINIVIRPHPSNSDCWMNYPETSSIVIFPRRGDLPDVQSSRQTYFDTLYHSHGVIGVNTSAFIEAAIIDRPCITLLDDFYRQTQEELPHFHHLLDAGFLETSASIDEFLKIVAAISKGADQKALQRRQFVETFVRPRGIEQPTAPIMGAMLIDVMKRTLIS